jgi:hypothetical protein
MRPAAVRAWLRQVLIKSVRYGASQGALAGALPGAVVGMFNWAVGSPLDWTMLLTFGGAAGGLMRGWKPGYRLAGIVDRYVGWKRFWQVVGAIIGAMVGTMFGLIGALAIFPIFLGFFVGLYTGRYAGEKFWQTGNALGWERIWGALTAVSAGGFGWGVAKLAGALGMNYFGARLAVGLLPFTGDGSMMSGMVWLVVSGASGAIFGAFSGWVVDLAGRLSRLTD